MAVTGLTWLLAGSTGLLLASPHLAPAVTPPLIATTGLLALLWSTRRLGDDAVLRGILVTAYLVKAAGAAVLFYVSAYRLPLFRSQQLGEGWWTFARDSGVYDLTSRRIVEAWHLGLTLPAMAGEKGQAIAVAAVYQVLGSNFLHAVLVNAWFGGMAALLAVAFCRRFESGRWTLRSIAVIVGFWPSLILWSTQLVKDPLSITLILGLLLLIDIVWRRESSSRWRRAASWILLAAAGFVTQFHRDYVAFIAVAMTVPLVLVTLMTPQRGNWRRASAIAVVLAGAVYASVILDLARLVAPLRPEIAHFRLALAAQQTGRRDEAIDQYLTAARYNPAFAPAFRNLGALFACGGENENAIRAFEAYLGLAAGGPIASETASLVARLHGRPSNAVVECPRAYDQTDLPAGSVLGAVRTKFILTSDRLQFMKRTTPTFLDITRRGMAWEGRKSGWRSMVDSEVRVDTPARIARYAPRALVVLFLAPFPWQWFDVGGDGGSLRILAGGETFLIYVLILAMIVAMPLVYRRREPILWYTLAFAIVMGMLLSITIPNVGALFRLRVQVLILVVVTLGCTGVCERAYHRFRRPVLHTENLGSPHLT